MFKPQLCRFLRLLILQEFVREGFVKDNKMQFIAVITLDQGPTFLGAYA